MIDIPSKRKMYVVVVINIHLWYFKHGINMMAHVFKMGHSGRRVITWIGVAREIEIKLEVEIQKRSFLEIQNRSFVIIP